MFWGISISGDALGLAANREAGHTRGPVQAGD